MNLEDVKAHVQQIKNVCGDDEAAHTSEDDLHLLLLTAIANGECDDPTACAKEAIKTQEIDFARLCA